MRFMLNVSHDTEKTSFDFCVVFMNEILPMVFHKQDHLENLNTEFKKKEEGLWSKQ